jgi:hypothetical protein
MAQSLENFQNMDSFVFISSRFQVRLGSNETNMKCIRITINSLGLKSLSLISN